MAERGKKRLRGHSFNDIHKNFLKHKDTVLAALELTEKTKFCFLKIMACNAAFPCSFSKAWCPTVRSLDDDDKSKHVAVRFSSLFDVGIIRRFIEKTSDIESALTDHQLTAFQRLSEFLESNEHQKITKDYVKQMPGSNWAAVLGTHVLKKLAVENNMLVTSDYLEKMKHCPCGCRATIQYGDLSMGHKDVWHGSVDILLGPVAILVDAEAEDTVGSSSIEVKRGELKESRAQLIAETIVFSYLKKTGLVPTVCMSTDWCKLFMYDPAYDLLYESMDCPLFDRTGEAFETSSILVIWFAINFAYFCTGVKKSHEEEGYLSGFKEMIPKDVLSIYENGLGKGGCSHVSCEKNDKWLIEPGNYKVLD